VSGLVLPSGETSGVARVAFRVSDSSGDAVSIDVEYEDLDDPRGWQAATSIGPPPTDIDASPGGVDVLFLWDVPADEPGRDFQARVRLTPNDGFDPGLGIEGDLHVDNNSEPLALVDGSAFFATPDRRRGIPIPVRVLDDEGDAVRLVFQWKRAGESFPDLPSDPAQIDALLVDPEQRRERQIATIWPTKTEGLLVPTGASAARLGGLGGASSTVLARGLVGEELRILRTDLAPVDATAAWTANPLVVPVAALPFWEGGTSIFLDQSPPATWRLGEVDAGTGELVRVIAGGTDGQPSALAWLRAAQEPDEGSVLVGTHSSGVWTISTVDLASGSIAQVATASGLTVLGPIRGILATGTASCLITVGNSLVSVAWTDPLNVIEEAIFSDLEGPFGLARHPVEPGRLFLAERDWVNPASSLVEGRVVDVYLPSRSRSTVMTSGAPLARPTCVALEDQGYRLLAVTDGDTFDGSTELRGVHLAGPLASVVFEVANGLPDDAQGLVTGPHGLREFMTPSTNQLFAGGGLLQVRTIVAFDPFTQEAVFDTPLDPTPGPLLSWCLTPSPESVTPTVGEAREDFVWDSSEVGQGGLVSVRVVPYDTEVGQGTDTGTPRSIKAPLDVTPILIGGLSMTDGVTGLASFDLDGDGMRDLFTSNSAGDSVSVFLAGSGGSYGASPDLELTGIPIVAPMIEPRSICVVDGDDDGDLDLASANRGSNNVTLFVQLIAGSLTTSVPALSKAGSGPVDLDAADLDGDGRQDLAVAEGAGSSLRIYPQLPVGLYSTITSSTVGAGVLALPTSVVAADLDVNGDVDLLCSDAGLDGVAVFLQDGSGFPAAPTLLLGGVAAIPSPSHVAVADLDLDGLPDVVSASPSANRMAVFIQRPGTGLPSTPDHLLSAPAGPIGPLHVSTADIDRDGRPDLVSANAGDDLSVFFSDPFDGGFGSDPLVLDAGGDLAGPVRTLPVDLDFDGLMDLVVANEAGNNVALLLQRRAGVFSSASRLGSTMETDGPEGLAVADLDGDGDLDIVSANAFEHTLTVFHQFSPAVYSPSPSLTIGSPSETQGVRSVATGDLDGDLRIDIVAASYSSGSLAVFQQEDDGGFPVAPDATLGWSSLSTPTSVVVEDLDGDGDLDIACTDDGADVVAIFPNEGGGSFASVPSLIGGPGFTGGAVHLVAADVDGDGRTDLMSANRDDDTFAIFLQDAFGVFPAIPDAVLGEPGQTDGSAFLACGDLDGDSDLDFVGACPDGDRLAVFLQDGTGAFPAGPDASLSDGALRSPESVSLGDIDLDGDLDIVSGNTGSGNVTIFLQVLPGTFVGPRVLAVAGDTEEPRFIDVTDLDGDGDPDIVLTNRTSDRVSIFFGSH